MWKVLQNESKKFFSKKIFLFEILLMAGLCGLAVVAYKEMAEIAANNLPRAQSYSEEMKHVLMNMNGVRFAKLFLTDFIYKNYFSFFLIFIVIHTVQLFSSDRENGTMKFTLLTGVEQGKLLLGKLLFMACYIGLVLGLNMILSLLVGSLFFGVSGDVSELMEYLGINFLAVFPGMTMAVIVALLSQLRISSKVMMTVGLLAVFLLGMLDTMTPSALFSPIGALSLFFERMPKMEQELLTYCLVSTTYMLIDFIFLRGIAKRYEYYE